MGHGLMENRHGLLVDACLTLTNGHAERAFAEAEVCGDDDACAFVDFAQQMEEECST